MSPARSSPKILSATMISLPSLEAKDKASTRMRRPVIVREVMIPFLRRGKGGRGRGRGRGRDDDPDGAGIGVAQKSPFSDARSLSFRFEAYDAKDTAADGLL